MVGSPRETRAETLRADAPGLSDAADVAVEYRGDRPVLLLGRPSGRVYTFTATRRVRQVTAEDAARLVRNPLFRLARPDDDEGRSHGTAEEGVRRGRHRAPAGSR